MKRIRAHPLPLLALFACFASVAVAQTPLVPLPDRNPDRAAPVAAVSPEVSPPADGATGSVEASEVTSEAPAPAAPEVKPTANVAEATTVAPMPARNPALPAPSLLAPPSAPVPPSATPAAPQLPSEPVQQIVTDIPFPEPNPNRADAAMLATMKGTLVPAIDAPKPKLDYAAILKPLLSYDLSSADESYVRAVMQSKGDAETTAAKISDPASRAYALWYKYRNGVGGSAEAIEQFRLTHPDWPGQDELRERAEIALLLNESDTDKVKIFLGASPPQTGAGKAALAGVHLKDGNEPSARELVVSAWRDHRLNAAVEKKILDRFGSMLTTEHHRARIDMLLYPDDKSSAEAALRVSKLLSPAEQKKVAARVAVVKRGDNAGTLLKALPAGAVEADVGLRYNHIQWLRRTKDKERREQAWKMLLDTPSEPNAFLDLNNWWTERRINCRGALNDGQTKVAYDIAAKHGLVSGDGYIEAEFLAGWIALRFLNDPPTALRHFLSLRRVATSSKSITLGEYWLGRTALALGDQNSAIIHFHGAAKYPQYFYGQLARQALDPKPAHLDVTLSPVPTEADIQSFLARDAVRAIGIAQATGNDWVTPQFFLSLARKLENPAEVVLVAELAKATDKKQLALRLSRIAFNRDLPLGDYAMPVGVMPQFKSLLKERIDPALLHALSRQESEFNAAAKSPVGAAGLMQLMPATARGIARKYKVPHAPSMLTNPVYNQQLGEAFLSDLIEDYGGSIFMSLAAYNAGGGRVAEWVKSFGDPRTSEIDPVDWIERIPFTETREYVFKIMESLQLYRSRLAGPNQALQLVQDLNRGRKVPPAATASVVEVKAD
ncbi:MAG TPA: transglycosylase SLT domain-containing protein [Methyloceanibacter sp.]|nr:transglycosylase SLT domain-containing protein [Methyloceanibacter sp.]